MHRRWLGHHQRHKRGFLIGGWSRDCAGRLGGVPLGPEEGLDIKVYSRPEGSGLPPISNIGSRLPHDTVILVRLRKSILKIA